MFTYLSTLSLKIVDLLITNSIIEKKDKDIFFYSIEVFISLIVNLIVAFILSLIFNRIINGVIFIVSFKLLRKKIGGYHAKTQGGCIIIFSLVYFLYLIIIQTIPKEISIIISPFFILYSIFELYARNNKKIFFQILGIFFTLIATSGYISLVFNDYSYIFTTILVLFITVISNQKK